MNNLAIFASGSGTNADAICKYFANNPSISVGLIITNKKEAGVLEIAKKRNIPAGIVNREQLNDEAFLLGELKNHQINLIVLAGFMVMIPAFLVREYQNRMINIHPALLPKFGGKGMYGKHVHEAVLKAGEKKSGITIHHVTEEYDEGKIIFQAEVTISPDETIASLEEKIHRLEHENYPKIIEKLVGI